MRNMAFACSLRKTGAAPFSMQVLAHSGFVGVMSPLAAREAAQSTSENQPVQVTLFSSAWPMAVRVKSARDVIAACRSDFIPPSARFDEALPARLAEAALRA